MDEHDDVVIEQLAAQRRRPRREPPTHRPASGSPHTITVAQPPPLDAGQPAGGELDRGDADRDRSQRPAIGPIPGAAGATPARPTPPNKAVEPLRLCADEPSANFAVRVRRTLDELLAWQLAQLRRQGTRTTKVELTELLLWELAQADLNQIAQRLQAFREHAPR